MKRSELSVGQEVEIQTGTTYKRFENAIVIFTEPWDDDRFSNWSKHDFRPASKGSGVAVAVEDRFTGLRNPASWRPQVAQLRKLVPKGTRAADTAARETAEVHRIQEDNERKTREASLRKRAGVGSEYDLRFRYVLSRNSSAGYFDTSTVEVNTRVLEQLLSELEFLRAITTTGPDGDQ